MDDMNNKSVYNFNLPISYLKNKYTTNKNIKEDLEIYDENNNNLYLKIFNAIDGDIYDKKISYLFSEYYTTDLNFLKDTKDLIKGFNKIGSNIILNNENSKNIWEILNELKNDTGFNEKYKYLSTEYFEFLNYNSTFLHIQTIYNLTNPILTLIIPIILLIIPFILINFILKKPLSIDLYINQLMIILKYHFIGKIINQFQGDGIDKKMIGFFSLFMYFLSIYQSFISCYKFYINFNKIKNYLNNIKIFIKDSINNIDIFNNLNYNTYKNFIDKNQIIKKSLLKLVSNIKDIDLNRNIIILSGNYGNILLTFYELFKNNEYQNSLEYCLYFNAYLKCIKNINEKVKNKIVTFCKFNKKTTYFEDAYYFNLENKDHVKNSYDLSKNIIISGPNASGKTTILKTTLINIILSQQLGCGYYKKAIINPYNYIYSYLNIPDTSNRDSLFQSEVRRCKEILDNIKINKNERHFCIFDELYSGTNPNEAISSGYGILNYLSKLKNINFLITTHYYSLCTLLDSNNNIVNKNMKMNNFEKTYKLVNNISKIKGGIRVLEEFNYDKNIVEDAKSIIDSLNI